MRDLMSDLGPPAAPPSKLERFLGVFTEVRAGEGATALLLTLNVFVLLTAYYVIKPVREALILAMEGGAEYKSYMSGAIAIALLFAVPAYARVAGKTKKHKLVIGVTLFFSANLLLFFIAANIPAVAPYLGLLFFLWVGIFNMMAVAQFWAFANDLYSEEQGKRLFALVGLGASVGAAVGSKVSAWLIEPLGTNTMLLVAAAMLAGSAAITWAVYLKERNKAPKDKKAAATAAPDDKGGAFEMVLKHRYLLLIALFSLVFSCVNTNGEYILGTLIKEDAKAAAAAGTITPDKIGDYIGAAYGDFFFYVNVLGVILQSFVVSRLIKRFGLGPTFFIMPVIALLDATATAILPVLAVLRIGKTAENATDYSINNTTRNMLWLPTTTEMKYKAKQAVDTFFVRMGDVGSALFVYVGATLIDVGVRGFAVLNAALVLIWLGLARGIMREQEKLHRSD